MSLSGQTAILGAGLQGACIALELARRGQRVLLLEQDERPLNRTSIRNEGKIHLGLVYANDPMRATAGLMLEGALHFFPLLSEWLGTDIPSRYVSTPFTYLVAHDSLLNPDQLEQHYETVEQSYHRILAERPGLNYLGLKPPHLFRRLSEEKLTEHFAAARLLGGFATEERAVNTDELGRLLRSRLVCEPNIELMPARTVRAVERLSSGFRILGDSPEGTWKLEARQVVNATWANRMAIDRTVGLEPESDCLHRLKFRVLAHLPDFLQHSPSVTMVIGPYGDVVVRPDGTVYLSWYPAALRGWQNSVEPPASWNEAASGNVEPELATQIADDILQAIDEWYPGISRARPYQVDAGIILARGRTDVDDHASTLHNRTQIGVESVDGYHSVSTGKYTTAPLFALQAAEAIMQHPAA